MTVPVASEIKATSGTIGDAISGWLDAGGG
jgi:hypothetical protein